MKVITLKQPWATLVAEGLKKYEFRSWKLNYRGEILIHAGKGIDKDAMDKFKHLNLNFPHSRIVARVNILDCIELNQEINKNIIKQNELVYGHKYNRTGYAWKLEVIEKINNNKEVSGKQGIWNLEKE
ncbi:MAG: ASCH domain-containing protein [Firmicutes bacterium]|nr:ASCH domain-containing protein [Bacillota bacterium]